MEEKIMVIDRPYLNSAVNRTEKWLKEQANSGWRLIEKKGVSYTFRKCRPFNAEYFIYGSFNASKGISFDFHMAKKLYSNTHAEINKLAADLFEADISKIDKKYYEYKDLRNTYYKKHYTSMSVLFGALTFLSGVICFAEPIALLFLAVPFIIFIFNLFSLLNLCKDMK